MIKIRSISFRVGLPVVRYTRVVDELTSTDSVFPGKGSGEVMPSNEFATRLDGFTGLLQSFDIPDVDWTLKSLALLWDKEGEEYGFAAVLTYWDEEKSVAVDLKLKQDSPDHMADLLRHALGKVVESAIAFVGGESAQGRLPLDDVGGILANAARARA